MIICNHGEIRCSLSKPSLDIGMHSKLKSIYKMQYKFNFFIDNPWLSKLPNNNDGEKGWEQYYSFKMKKEKNFMQTNLIFGIFTSFHRLKPWFKNQISWSHFRKVQNNSKNCAFLLSFQKQNFNCYEFYFDF